MIRKINATMLCTEMCIPSIFMCIEKYLELENELVKIERQVLAKVHSYLELIFHCRDPSSNEIPSLND